MQHNIILPSLEAAATVKRSKTMSDQMLAISRLQGLETFRLQQLTVFIYSLEAANCDANDEILYVS
jgi:hypothetical protein